MAVDYQRARTHTIYKTSRGRVPGVTTVGGVLNKPALVPWANRIGLQGIEVGKYVDALAGVGTLSHKRVECEFTGETVDTSEYSQKDIDLSDNAMISFYDWQKRHTITEVKNELILVSEMYGYGGTIDIYCVLDGERTLLDIKTGKAIYPDMRMQVSAYAILLNENGYPVDEVRILRIGREENEGFDDSIVRKVYDYFEIFKHCLEIYKMKRNLNWR
jgi:hypothetical protein